MMDYHTVKFPLSFDAGEEDDWTDDLEHFEVSWRSSVPAVGTKLSIVRPDHTSRTWVVEDVIHETHLTRRGEPPVNDAYQIIRVIIKPVVS